MASRPATSFSISNRITRFNTRSISPGKASIQLKNLNSTKIDFFQTNFSKNIFDTMPCEENPEKNELHSQLKLLKNRLNQTKTERNALELTFNKVKSDLNTISNKEKHTGTKNNWLKSRKKTLKTQLNELVLKIKYTLADYESNKYMYERLKNSQIFLDKKKNFLNTKISLKNEICKEELIKKYKVLEQTGRNIRKYRNLSLDYNYKDKTRDLVSTKIEKDIKNKQNLALKRDNMKLRREKILESVANEEKILKNNALKHAVLLHKFWYQNLNKKLLKEMNQFNVIEKAYANIKSLTGLNNINEVLEKILTRETNYNLLMKMINENKVKCENFRLKNLEIESWLKNLAVKEKMIQGKNGKGLDLLVLKNIRKNQKAKDKINEIKRVKDFVLEWAKNKIRKMNPGSTIDSKSISEVFVIFKSTVSLKIREFKENVNAENLVKTRDSRSLSFNGNPNNAQIEEEIVVKFHSSLRRNTLKL